MDITQQGNDSVWRASEIDKATNCARQLGYSRLGFVSEPGAPPAQVTQEFSWSLVAGLAMDDTLTNYSKLQMVGQNASGWSFATDFFKARLITNLDEAQAKGTLTGDDTFENVLDEGTRIIDLYVRDMVPIIHPVAVQHQAETQIGDTKLVGHIDLIRKLPNGTQVISDWKFTTKTANQIPASGYLRGHAYDLMAGDGSGQIELILLRRGLKTAKIETTSHFVTKGEHQSVKQQVKILTEMYRKRYFPMASPGNWYCSKKFCGFWEICRGNPKGPAAIPGEV